METVESFSAFIDDTLQLEELFDVIGGVETEYSISLSDIGITGID